MQIKNRVVITGMGMVTPLGLNLEESWSALIHGKSGIDLISRFSTDSFEVKIAGEIKGFNPDLYIGKKEQKKMDTFIHYSLACAQMALEQAGLKPVPEFTAEKTGVIVGVGIGGLPSIEEQYTRLKEKGPDRMTPFFIPMVITNLASGQISISYGLKGPNYSVTSACASGAHSIGEAFKWIQSGECEVMLAGGSESTICPLAIGGFNSMKALSTRNDEPKKASRPFDQERDGFVLSEGAAILVLESLSHAKSRGARILAELVGYGASSDAYHMTNPAPEGQGAALAIEKALQSARLNPEQIGYINAHGTSTPVGDELETLAIKRVFKEHSKNLWVSSTKSMTGHTLGAAGAIESAFCIQTLIHQIAPATINLDKPSPNCDLDYIPHKAREVSSHNKLNYVVNNSFGFGGTNACLIFACHEE